MSLSLTVTAEDVAIDTRAFDQLEKTMRCSRTNLSALKRRGENFNHMSHTTERAVWSFLLREENIVRMVTATAVERAAVESLSEALVVEFGEEIAQPEVKQVIGHMVRQIMEFLGYEVDRRRLRITRPGLFASGMSFRLVGEARIRSDSVTPDQRREWVKTVQPDAFNCWLDAQVKTADGTIDHEQLWKVAQNWGLEKKLRGNSVSLDRLDLGIMLREVVPPSDYEAADDERHSDGDNDQANRQARDIQVFGRAIESREDAERLAGVRHRRDTD